MVCELVVLDPKNILDERQVLPGVIEHTLNVPLPIKKQEQRPLFLTHPFLLVVITRLQQLGELLPDLLVYIVVSLLESDDGSDAEGAEELVKVDCQPIDNLTLINTLVQINKILLLCLE